MPTRFLPIQQDVDAFLDLLFEAVIEVVEHLHDEVLIVEFAEDDIVFLV